MSGGTTDWWPSVPMTSGYVPFVPGPDQEIYRRVPNDGATTGQPTKWVRVYPIPESET